MKSSLCTAATGLAAVFALAGAAQAQSIEDLFIRRIDGVDPFHLRPETGAADIPLVRIGPNSYADGVSIPGGGGRPSARAVSNAVHSQAGSRPAPQDLSDFVWQWGQFVDHDLDLTEGATPAEAFPIAVPNGDPEFDPMGTGTQVINLNRSIFEIHGGVREQVNEITAWIDASNVYGSDYVRNAALRNADGSLKTSPGGLLPYNTVGLPNAGNGGPAADFFLAGDVRSNEQMGLATMHTLFVREHNLLVTFLGFFGITGDSAYEIARMIVMGEMQAITYNEFLPVVLGDTAIPAYTGWRPIVDAGIRNEFSTAAFRFGHTMLSPTLLRLDAAGNEIANGHVPLQGAFFDPSLLEQDGIACVLRGLASQRPQAIDPFIVDDVRNFLFGPPGAGGLDLPSLNLQRGRDHGIPSYNDTRRALGLPAANRPRDISSVRNIRRRLRSVYNSIEDIDLWTGGLCEDPVSGSLVGETIRTILVDQFTRVRDSDRFYYERYLPGPFVAFVNSRNLGQIIRDNTSAGNEIQANVFRGGN